MNKIENTFVFVTVVLCTLFAAFIFSPQNVDASKGYRDRCPPYEILYPCYCNSFPKQEDGATNRCGVDSRSIFDYRCQSPVITCIGHRLDHELRSIFRNVSRHIHNPVNRRFEWFYLIDDDLRTLPADSFEHMFFRNIYLKSCPRLAMINATAFGRANAAGTRNLFINASALADDTRSRRETFRAFNSLRNLDTLEIQLHNFTAIPLKAFNRATNLRVIRFGDPDAATFGSLRRIGSKAFFKANRLEEIDLKRNRLARIAANAFQFQQPSTHEVKIFLAGNELGSDSFEVGSLLGGNGRNMTIYLGDYGDCNHRLITLRREVFEPFFAENRGNIIDMYGCPLRCDHRMKWLTFNLERYRNQIRNLECVAAPEQQQSSRQQRQQSTEMDRYNYYHVST